MSETIAPTDRTGPSHEAETALVRPARMTAPIVAGFAVIILFFGVFGGWAAMAPLESAALAPGVVSVENSRRTIQHLEGGIVGEILARDGERVAAKQVLIRLDETQRRSALDLLRGRWIAANALQSRLIAERDDLEEVRFSEQLLAKKDEPAVREAVQGQRNIFESRKKTLRSQISILVRGATQYLQEIKGLKGQIKAQNRQLTLIREELKGLESLFEKGFAQKPRLLALQRQSAEIEGSRSQNQASIARAQQSVVEANLRVAELRANRINEAVEQLRDVQSELFDLSERIAVAEDTLSRTEIRAPIDGTIVGMQVHTPGGVISPGQHLMDIVPSGESLIIEAQVDPADIDVISTGHRALVNFPAFNLRTTAPVEGIVASISADRLTDPNQQRSYYLARVELPPKALETLGDQTLVPGMQADVMIVTGKLPALDYFFRPVARSLDRAFREE